MDSYLTTAEVAERFRLSPETLRWWRHIGYGPRGVKVGRKKVLYPESEVERFDAELRNQERTGT